MNDNQNSILKFIAQSISECIIEVTKNIDIPKIVDYLKPIFDELREFKEVLEKVGPACQEKMYNSKWVPLLPPSAPIVEFVGKIASDEINEQNIDEFVFNQLGNDEQYFNQIKKVLNRFTFEEGFNQTIIEILEAYKIEKYHLVVTSTMPIIERLTSGEKYVRYDTIKEEQIQLMSTLLDSDLGSDFINNHLFKTITDRSQLTDDIIISRHAVSHGFDFCYNKKKALNCIILIDYFLQVDTGYLICKQCK